MAFTDVETAQVHDAVKMDPTGEDLCKLGLLYSTGQCGVIDYVEAHKWFNLASLMGSDTAKYYRSEVAAEMDGEQIAAALTAAPRFHCSTFFCLTYWERHPAVRDLLHSTSRA